MTANGTESNLRGSRNQIRWNSIRLNIIKIGFMQMSCWGFITLVGETRNAYRILVRKPEEKKLFERPGIKGNIKKEYYCLLG
jgi:hypothetical protein